ncbi:hypothetical protein F2P81_000639 [Scophthalmus maximus]|nr:hypothetical protein F2P81_000639 [Scophthalmus maximus]
MRFLLLFSRQGKLRLQKWFTPISEREKKKIIRDMTSMVLARQPRSCNFLHWKDLKIIYKRYASLYFCLAVDNQENELLALEVIHRYVELLDKYFGNVFHRVPPSLIQHSTTIVDILMISLNQGHSTGVCKYDIKRQL